MTFAKHTKMRKNAQKTHFWGIENYTTPFWPNTQKVTAQDKRLGILLYKNSLFSS